MRRRVLVTGERRNVGLKEESEKRVKLGMKAYEGREVLEREVK